MDAIRHRLAQLALSHWLAFLYFSLSLFVGFRWRKEQGTGEQEGKALGEPLGRVGSVSRQNFAIGSITQALEKRNEIRSRVRMYTEKAQDPPL